jgi:hypothetical protein
MTGPAENSFPFRPWVRRAGASIVIVAALATAAIALTLTLSPSARYGWMREPFVWVYLGVLWLGGLRVFLGTFRPIVETDDARIIIRPLHQLIIRRIPWETIRGTEQSGDRLIIYFETPRGMRFVALNLNLVKGRREFLTMLESRLSSARSAAGRAGNPS